MHEIKVEINRVEHEVIRAHKVLEQRLKGFEDADAWTSDDLATELGSGRPCTRKGSGNYLKNNSQ